ncbi:hypothetical protein [Parabacteroides distasonis]|uniref:hypothetical protein n=1 Tax=Parabacteroides distasonis TaxID=823 RepID=UPI0039B4CE95
MKIGILTQPLRGNYGGVLQNWALQQILIRLGHEPITIDILLSLHLLNLLLREGITQRSKDLIVERINLPIEGRGRYLRNL